MKKILLAVVCLMLLIGSFYILNSGMDQAKAGYEMDVISTSCHTMMDY